MLWGQQIYVTLRLYFADFYEANVPEMIPRPLHLGQILKFYLIILSVLNP